MFDFDRNKPPVFILGPCVIESLDLALSTAEYLKELSEKLGFQLVYKSSFDKANRTSITSYRGPGLEEGLKILERVKREFAIPICTDIHLPDQAQAVSEVADIIQIPAFLCRQTDLLVSAAQTGRWVNIKKGQFLSPENMIYPVQKVRDAGCEQIIITERGTMFGYQHMVVDFCSIPIMQSFQVPICFDATHSVQRPSPQKSTAGAREYIPTLAKAAIAAGTDLLYLETHPQPEKALCDASNVFDMYALEKLLTQLIDLRAHVS